jgi:hypothetical protein
MLTKTNVCVGECPATPSGVTSTSIQEVDVQQPLVTPEGRRKLAVQSLYMWVPVVGQMSKGMGRHVPTYAD